MPTNITDPAPLAGVPVLGNQDEKIGKVEQIYLDNQTSAPEWVSVKTGMLGNHVSLVPLAESNFDGDQLRVPYDKAQIKDAPHHDAEEELSQEDEADLYAHYGFTYSEERSDSGLPAGDDSGRSGQQTGGRHDRGGEPGIEGRDTSGPTIDDAMTRSEEQLHVGTESVQAGKARLRKYVVTENVTTTVPVSHEEVRLEREPIIDANRSDAMAGRDITEEEHEVTLTAERPVVGKETVPVERVRLGTETVTEEQTVSESVRKEKIDNPETTTDNS